MSPSAPEPRSRRVPEYVRIANDIREAIKDGSLGPDERVPSASTLCDQYDVSMITAKSALNLLRSEGLLYGVAGKGTFVAHQRRMIRTAPHRYFQRAERTYIHEAERAGKQPDVQYVTTTVPASAWVAQRLDIDPDDPVTETVYTTFSDGRPMSSSHSWEPLSITGGTAIEHPHQGEHAQNGLNARFAAIGWTVDQVEEHIVVREPTPTERTALAIPQGVPVAEIRQTVRAVADGQDDLVPVEAADIVFPTDRYEFRYLMDRPR
jgi:GntR family transcriptional regulator